jgi:hypothetical protein
MIEVQQLKAAALADAGGTDFYEHGFARIEGMRRGITSMPLSAAQTLLQWEGYHPKADLSRRLTIDPACGSGNALLAAAHLLAARGRVRRWGPERVVQEIEQCIWGLDPDPVACHVAELRLRRLVGHLLPDLPAARRKAMQLHIHQTDSLTLPADARFHLVVTNPPLATARGVVISHEGFVSDAPPRDVWLRFLEQSMRLVSYGGALAIALPETMLTKAAAAALRDELAREWTIERIGHQTGVFRSGPGAVLILARRQDPPADNVLEWERIERVAVQGEGRRLVRVDRKLDGTIAQSSLPSGARGQWRYALGEAERAFVQRMAHPVGPVGRVRLGEIVHVTRGAEIWKDAPEPEATPTPGTIPILRALDVTPFRAQSRFWLPRAAFKGEPAQWSAPKIVVPRGSARLVAALDDSGSAPLAALFAIGGGATPADDLPWLAALLNSRPLRVYLALTQTAYQIARPSIELAALRDLPIVQCSPDARSRLRKLGAELARHTARRETMAVEEYYPVVEHLGATLDLEVSALYGLTPDDQEVLARWKM